ncbi:acyl carrier protein [Kitasatospora sp. GAS204B]|uniref:acyl carrier protein n=1 Tax=unclassified Kitasatospora TaxID=2633591 RepID=UPI0024761E7F|nr:acyl carrier protein [Kitasatospora sp. GAS204B]MDH6121664.1 acyl carrier protein [Kitasatospora sp. GAS204B]
MSSLVNPVLARVLVSAFQLSDDALLPTATLEELGLDSLAVVELSDILAEELGVAIVDGELAAAASLGRIGELLGELSGADRDATAQLP